MPDPEKALNWLELHHEGSVARLIDWLRIPSVSTDPAFRKDCRNAADWAARHLRDSGLRVEVRETGTPANPGHPIVMAFSEGSSDYTGPHVLFYGHYDVQPPDPLEQWESPPFEPRIRDGEGGRRVVARGAVDDKGQVMTFLESLRAWKETTGLVAGGVRFTVLLEGEEESGSANLEAFIRTNAEELKRCAFCLISDTGMLARDKPAITYGVRGLAYTEVSLHAANQDLHSGLWGGRAPNPAVELAKILAGLWDSERRVTIPGFYDPVREPSPEERQAWAELGFDAASALAKIGLPAEADTGEQGFSPLEREWARPTAEINGIVSGYTGHGAKTIIPAKATAKVSFRLVADQAPDRVAESFFSWLRGRTPPGCRWEFINHGGGHPATCPTDSAPLRAARRALERAAGTPPALIKTGGSIPIAGMLKARLGLDTIFMGFGLDDDRVHSPNEKFELACFRLGARAHVLLIDELRRAGRG